MSGLPAMTQEDYNNFFENVLASSTDKCPACGVPISESPEIFRGDGKMLVSCSGCADTIEVDDDYDEDDHEQS